MHPSLKFLGMAPEASVEWREKVRAFHAKQAAKNANVKALNGLDRNVVGTAGSTVNLQFTHYFTLYETTLNLANLGLSGRTLQSITFNDTSVHQATSIFAVDGVVAAPEPASVSVLALLAGSLVFRPRRKSA